MKKILKISLIVLIAALISGYGIGCWYFYGHYYYGTTIDGILYGCLTGEQVRQDVQSRHTDYRLEIKGRYGLTDTLEAREAGITVDPEENLRQILMVRQPFYLWPEGFFWPHDYRLEHYVTIEEEAFRKAVEETVFFDPKNIRKPQNAKLSGYSYEKKGYAIIPEKEGNEPDKGAFLEAVRMAAERLENTVEVIEADCYVQPTVFSDDYRLVTKVNRLNACTGIEITYDMHGIPVTLDGDEIHEWLIEGPYSVRFDEELVAAYVQGLADTYDTINRKQKFITVKGRQTELRGTSYGWKLDVEEETKALLEMLNSGQSVKREPVWLSEGYELGLGNEESNYVEVDLGAQHLYVIREGKIVLETDIVSGNMAKRYGTPSGIYAVYAKQKNRILRGADYASFVNYWIPFYRGYGLHDATWRGSFGGSIYMTGGSHGCVNMPLSKAKEVYNLVSVGTPVVLYY